MERRCTMKRTVICLAILSIFAVFAISYAQGPGMMGPGYGGYGMRPGMMGSGQQGWQYCPYCGQALGQGGYGMGHGMMGRGGMMGGGYGYHMGPGMMGPGYYQQNEACQKFLDETAGTRKDFHNKRYEYFEAIRNPQTTPETAAKLEKELRDLHEKIYANAPQGCSIQQ
jgi:hypothetical protein